MLRTPTENVVAQNHSTCAARVSYQIHTRSVGVHLETTGGQRQVDGLICVGCRTNTLANGSTHQLPAGCVVVLQCGPRHRGTTRPTKENKDSESGFHSLVWRAGRPHTHISRFATLRIGANESYSAAVWVANSDSCVSITWTVVNWQSMQVSTPPRGGLFPFGQTHIRTFDNPEASVRGSRGEEPVTPCTRCHAPERSHSCVHDRWHGT